MLHIRLDRSMLAPHLRWDVNARLAPGEWHWLRGPNGSGKTSFFAELKLQWGSFAPAMDYAFVDQEPFAPFHGLRVAEVFDILWEAAPERRSIPDWRRLPWWEPVTRAWWGRRVSLLSGGENQWLKILLMRSLRADAWLLDEPFQSLDLDRQAALEELMRAWTAEGKYLLMSHHGPSLRGTSRGWRLQPGSHGLCLEEGA